MYRRAGNSAVQEADCQIQDERYGNGDANYRAQPPTQRRLSFPEALRFDNPQRLILNEHIGTIGIKKHRQLGARRKVLGKLVGIPRSRQAL